MKDLVAIAYNGGPFLNKDGEAKFILAKTTLEKNKLVVAHFKKTSKVLKEIRYQCSECKQKFIQQYYLTRHLWLVHQIGDGVSHQCTECNKKFLQRWNLNRHLLAVYHIRGESSDTSEETADCLLQIINKHRIQLCHIVHYI